MFSSSLYTACGTNFSAPRYTRLSCRYLRLDMSPWSLIILRRCCERKRMTARQRVPTPEVARARAASRPTAAAAGSSRAAQTGFRVARLRTWREAPKRRRAERAREPHSLRSRSRKRRVARPLAWLRRWRAVAARIPCAPARSAPPPACPPSPAPRSRTCASRRTAWRSAAATCELRAQGRTRQTNPASALAAQHDGRRAQRTLLLERSLLVQRLVLHGLRSASSRRHQVAERGRWRPRRQWQPRAAG